MFPPLATPGAVSARPELFVEVATRPRMGMGAGGAAIRAMLGRRTGRTSMPSVWVGGEFVGGCNDGGLGGVITLDDKGTLNPMLKKAGALK